MFLKNGLQLDDLLMSGVLRAPPRRSSSSRWSRGIGWIPFVLEAMDYQFMGNSVTEEHPEFDRCPRSTSRATFIACYWFEQVAPRRLIDKIGVDRMLFETDFPHPTSLYGDEVYDRIKPAASSTPTTRCGARSCGRTARSCTRSLSPPPPTRRSEPPPPRHKLYARHLIVSGEGDVPGTSLSCFSSKPCRGFTTSTFPPGCRFRPPSPAGCGRRRSREARCVT